MKKLFTLLLLSLFTHIEANNILLNGICYSINNNTASVANGYFNQGNYVIIEYSGDIVIPESIEYEGQTYSVTTIADCAFQRCSALTSIGLPTNLETIGAYAFEDCIGLTNINIPRNVKSINEKAFYNCTEIEKITVDSENRRYDSRDDCNAIIWNRSSKPYLVVGCKNSTIPDGIGRIGAYSFYRCTGLTDIDIPNSVESIGESAFEGCTSLANVNLHEGLTTIEQNAFKDCEALCSIIIPQSVSMIALSSTGGYYGYFSEGSSPFTGCSGLETIVVGSGNETYDSRDGCNAIIESETNKLIVGCKNSFIPNNVSEIWVGAFQYCLGLKSVHIPSSINHIDGYLFSGCVDLTSITVDSDNPKYDSRDNCNAIIEKSTDKLIVGCKETIIPNSIKTIGAYAFGQLSYLYKKNLLPLKAVVIPECVENIEMYAFFGCRLENIIAKNPKTSLDGTSFSDRSFQHAMLYIPVGTWPEAVYDGGWYLFNNIREIATETANLSITAAYNLMNVKTYSYAVFDGLNDDIQIADTFYSIDTNSLSSCWQIVGQNGQYCLYNIGAGKYATLDEDGQIELSAVPVFLNMDNTNEGIMIGDDSRNKWAFVLNENVKPNDIASVMPMSFTTKDSPSYYSIGGQALSSPHKGINIMRINNGTKKLIIP